MARRLGWIALSLAALLVLLVGGAAATLAWFPGVLKPVAERALSAAVGQPVRIDGPISVDLGSVTTVDLQGLRVAAPDWARADDLASVRRLRVGVDVGAYLRDRTVRVAELRAEAPVVALERDAQGRTSWPAAGGVTADEGAGSDSAAPKLSVGDVTVTEGRVGYRDAVADVEVDAGLRTDAGGPGDSTAWRLDGTGAVRGDPLRFDLQVGGLQGLARGDGAGPVPVDGELTLAGTRATVAGEVSDPANLSGLALDLDLASKDPSGLLALAGRPAPRAGPLPPLELSARLTGGRTAPALEDLHARWGESAVEGRLRADLAAATPRLEGELRARLLDVAALQAALGPGEDQAPEQPWDGNPLQPLTGYAGRVELSAEEVRLPPQLVLRDVAATVELAEGRLRVAPLRAALPEGTVGGELATGPVDAPELTVDTRLRAEGAGLAGLAGEGYGGTVDGTLEGTLLVGPPRAMLTGSRLRLEVAGEGLRVPQAELGALAVTAALADGRLRLDPLRARLPEGEVAGTVAAGPFDRGFAADVDLEARGIDLAAAARVDGVAGRMDARLTGRLEGATPLELLTRSRLELRGGIENLRLPQVERELGRVALDATLDPGRREALRVVAEARAGDRPLALTVFGGSVESLAQNDGDYPFTVEAKLGNNDGRVNGTVSLPLAERRFSATVSLAGQDPSPILALFQLPRLQIPPYRVEGVLTNRGDELEVKGLEGRIGDSDVAADLTVGFGGERPRVTGELRSRVLDLDDLGGLVGGTPATGPGETASEGQRAEAEGAAADGQVLPDERLDPERWRVVDLDLELQAEELHAGKIPLDGFSGRVNLENGRLRVDPLELLVGGGRVFGEVQVDGAREPVQAGVELDLERISVARLLNRLDVDTATFGTLSGSARGDVGLGGQGLSVAGILGNADGRVQLVMEGGRVDRTIVAGLGLDLLRLFGSFVGATPETVALRCTVADLVVRDGVVRTAPLIVDTEIADLGGEGTVDLGTERIDITLTARPDEAPLPTDLTGISISGTLAEPQLDINPVALAARGAAAATLGLLVKPFTALADAADDEEELPCTALLDAEGGDAG